MVALRGNGDGCRGDQLRHQKVIGIGEGRLNFSQIGAGISRRSITEGFVACFHLSGQSGTISSLIISLMRGQCMYFYYLGSLWNRLTRVAIIGQDQIGHPQRTSHKHFPQKSDNFCTIIYLNHSELLHLLLCLATRTGVFSALS